MIISWYRLTDNNDYELFIIILIRVRHDGAMHAPAAWPPAAYVRTAVWAQTVPAQPEEVGQVRKSLARVLDGCPAAEDAIACLSELAANAVTHTRSAQPGGTFTVRARLTPAGRLRVEVTDQGGPWTQPAPRDGQHGRGLLIVRQLARDFGISSESHTSRTVWFELTCPCTIPPGTPNGELTRD
jgi:anti-sigma regulatory factor (Ser/Thr protein kinase)